jgi:hypothetical protein
MFFSIVKWVIISLTLIFLIHHLYMFLMNTLTVPKIKDLVNKPNQQYKDIYDTMQSTTTAANSTAARAANSTSTAAPAANADVQMTDELSTFLNDLKKTPSTLPGGDLLNNDLGYSLY